VKKDQSGSRTSKLISSNTGQNPTKRVNIDEIARCAVEGLAGGKFEMHNKSPGVKPDAIELQNGISRNSQE